MAQLYEHQKKALKKMKNGCVLKGGTGSGKSITSIEYYANQYGGSLENHKKMTDPGDLYIITTAKKRDKKDWDKELSNFSMSTDPELNYYKNKIVVDSWNNICKYKNITGAFFIFDEQRTVGTGSWAHAFIKIAEHNKWIMLSATPGDAWCDYRALFVANGFYRNMTDFDNRHVVYVPFLNHRQISRYTDTEILQQYKDSILVDMPYARSTEKHIEIMPCNYDKAMYRTLWRDRWNPYTNLPFNNSVELCYTSRKVITETSDKAERLRQIYKKHNKLIVFYNFTYELDLIKTICEIDKITMTQYNGKKHEEIPDTDSWIYAVQYTAGAEGWNCLLTDTIVFFSPNYSYKIMEQSAGRIDRLNTPFKDLYYYYLTSSAPIDRGILRCLKNKKKFNTKTFTKNIEF